MTGSDNQTVILAGGKPQGEWDIADCTSLAFSPIHERLFAVAGDRIYVIDTTLGLLITDIVLPIEPRSRAQLSVTDTGNVLILAEPKRRLETSDVVGQSQILSLRLGNYADTKAAQ